MTSFSIQPIQDSQLLDALKFISFNLKIPIEEREINYDHSADKRSERYTKKKLSFFNKELLPEYIKNNFVKFENWFYKN